MKLIELNNLIWDYIKNNPDHACEDVLNVGLRKQFKNEVITFKLESENVTTYITLVKENKNA